MCAAISRSEHLAGKEPVPCWSDGAARIALAAEDGVTRLCDLYQSDPCRVLFPRPAAGAPFEAVVVTTSGGIVGGDRVAVAVEVGPGSTATVTTQAAEKIYRSAGPDARLSIDLSAGAGSLLEWMPQETILFDGARLRRTIAIDAAPGARLLCGEMIVFGRCARGERFSRGFLHDGWRVTEAGRLVWADALHLDGKIDALMDRASGFDGAASLATLVYRADDAARRLDQAREVLEASRNKCPAAATCLGTLLVVRFLGPDAAATRRAVTAFWSGFREAVLGLPGRLPAVWNT